MDRRHVAILKIQDLEYSLEPIQLRTVRPFVFGEVILSEEREAGAKLETKAMVNKFLKSKVSLGRSRPLKLAENNL